MSMLIDKYTGRPVTTGTHEITSVILLVATKGMNKNFVDEFMKQIKNGNKVDNASFTKENGCSTNLLTDKGATGTMSQMCNPKCNFKFTSPNKK